MLCERLAVRVGIVVVVREVYVGAEVGCELGGALGGALGLELGATLGCVVVGEQLSQSDLLSVLEQSLVFKRSSESELGLHKITRVSNDVNCVVNKCINAFKCIILRGFC